MKSMTGHGSGSCQLEDGSIQVVLQSYNHKNFEARLQLPAFYAVLEGELRKELQKNFSRGSINLWVIRNPSRPNEQSTLRWNKKQALKWQKVYKDMAYALRMKNDLSLFNVSQQAGVIEVLAPSFVVSAKEKATLKTLVQKAMLLCEKERIREGQALRRDFQKNLSQLTLCLQNIKRHEKRQRKSQSQNLSEQISQLKNSAEQKTVHELMSALIDRIDIHEEVNRLKEHIKAFSSLIKGQAIMGKKMTFYLQEMIREANTIGSKSQDFKLTKEVVVAKSLIERMREQAHNIE